MNWRRIVTQGISDISSLAHVLYKPAPSYRILMYHAVDGEVIGDRLNIFGISITGNY